MQHTLNSMLIVVTYLFILHITKYRYTGMTVFFLTVYYRPNFPIPRNTSWLPRSFETDAITDMRACVLRA